jgi:hypothetical protein
VREGKEKRGGREGGGGEEKRGRGREPIIRAFWLQCQGKIKIS